MEEQESPGRKTMGLEDDIEEAGREEVTLDQILKSRSWVGVEEGSWKIWGVVEQVLLCRDRSVVPR